MTTNRNEMPAAEKKPCPFCGRLVKFQAKAGIPYQHKCPHGKGCLGGLGEHYVKSVRAGETSTTCCLECQPKEPIGDPNGYERLKDAKARANEELDERNRVYNAAKAG